MRWVPDKTGRFPRRPHYQPDAIDAHCERLVQKFLMKKYGKIEFPFKTEDITIFVEERADLDSCVDLSHEEGDVDGVTEFKPGQRPLVSISDKLSAPNMENRLRTTLTHEFGHVYFHQFMFDTMNQTASLFPEEHKAHRNRCKRATIERAAESDWMESQAGYAYGAILMPASALIEAAQAFRAKNRLPFTNLLVNSAAGQDLIGMVASTFQTSRDAARVRLLKKEILADTGSPNAALFLTMLVGVKNSPPLVPEGPSELPQPSIRLERHSPAPRCCFVTRFMARCFWWVGDEPNSVSRSGAQSE